MVTFSDDSFSEDLYPSDITVSIYIYIYIYIYIMDILFSFKKCIKMFSLFYVEL